MPPDGEGEVRLMDTEKARQAFAWGVARNRAVERAHLSARPVRFASRFEAALAEIREKGEEEFLGHPLDWNDSILVAAEVEALSAYRAVRYWGTGRGQCQELWLRKQARAA